LGRELAERKRAAQPTWAVAEGGHIMPAILAGGSAYFRLADPAGLAARLRPGDLVICFGYVSVPLDLWHAVRAAQARAAWIVAPLPEEIDYTAWGDRVIDQGWRIGDGAVAAAGYDIRILPPSGVAELVIYRSLLAAAASP
jgi:hypothetical protein